MTLRREWLGLALVLFGLARAALLVGHEPLLGYANQYDMIRSSACIGFYPDLPEARRYAATPEAPLPVYRTGSRRPDICYLSSEIFLDTAAATVSRWASGDSQALPLRAVGYVKLALLAIAALLIAWALHRNPGAAIFHGLVVAFIVGDPVVTLWMNTLYTEFAAIWGLYVAVAALATLALTERGRYVMAALLALALVALAFSREQFALLPPVLVVVAWPWLWYRSRHLAVASLGVAIVSAMVSFGLVPRADDVRKVNRTDTYLGLLVPASVNPEGALQRLGLPAHCAAMIGVNWYAQGGEDARETCPEVFRVSSVAFLAFARDEPRVLARAMARVMPSLQQVSPSYFGAVAGERGVRLEAFPPYLLSPLHVAFVHLPQVVFVVLLACGLMVGPVALVGALAWGRPSRAEHGTGLLVAMLLGLVMGYAFATTVFGDGLAESARHFLPGSLALAAACGGALVALPILVARWRAAPRQGALQAAALVAAVIAMGAACAVALQWMRVQPAAIGFIDQPAQREVRGGLTVRGWALDPSGVESVTVSLGTLRRSARYGESGSGDLAAYYPGYPDAAHARFALEIGAAELAGAGVQGVAAMRVEVRSRSGAVTEIDRRRLVISP